MAMDEIATIGATITAIQSQRQNLFVIDEIIVVSTTSTDGTDDAVRAIATGDARVKLVVEQQRRGKIFSVVNFFSQAVNDVCVVLSADVTAAPDCLGRLVSELTRSDTIAMVGPQIISVPDGSKSSIATKLNVLLWQLHHELALRDPKLGELIAVRKSFMTDIPTIAGCDEVMLEAAAHSNGGAIVYVADAIVYNRCLTKLNELITVRRRIHAQHLRARQKLRYAPSSLKLATVLSACLALVRHSWRRAPLLVLLIFVEFASRVQGALLVARKVDTHTWQATKSTRSHATR